MLFTKSLMGKILLLVLLLCCLPNSKAARLPKTNTKTIVNSTTEGISEETSKVATPVKAKAEVDADDDDDDDEDDDDDDDDDDYEDLSSKEADLLAEKTAIQSVSPSSLSVWGIVRGLWNWIKADLTEGLFGSDDATADVGEGRTFHKIRRLQLALIPIVFKFGVLSAMVAFLVAIGLKTLFFVKILLAMNALAILGKFFTIKTNFGHFEHSAPPSPPQPAWGWNPHVTHGWSSAPADHHPTKEIHLHIHGVQGTPQVQAYSSYNSGSTQQQSQGWDRTADPYNGYESYGLQDQNDLNSGASNVYQAVQQVNTNFPSNHRMF